MTTALSGEQLDERLFWQLASPFVRTLGIEVELPGDDSATMRLRALPRLSAREGGSIDPLVLPGLIDDCLSLAIGQKIPPDQGIATLDLWFAILRPVVQGNLVASARCIGVAGSTGTSAVEVRDEAGIILHGGGTFILGHYPSGATGNRCTAGRYRPSSAADTFRATIALAETTEGVTMAASDAVIGWEAGPVIHGGAVGSTLMAAACRAAPSGQRVSSMSIRYLRPALQGPLTAIARIDRAATRASHLSVEALSDGRIVAAGTAVMT